jgi:hypothetical protein
MVIAGRVLCIGNKIVRDVTRLYKACWGWIFVLGVWGADDPAGRPNDG